MSFVSLFIIGIISFLILKPLIGWLCDNRGKIDLAEEQRLTDTYKGKNY